MKQLCRERATFNMPRAWIHIGLVFKSFVALAPSIGSRRIQCHISAGMLGRWSSVEGGRWSVGAAVTIASRTTFCNLALFEVTTTVFAGFPYQTIYLFRSRHTTSLEFTMLWDVNKKWAHSTEVRWRLLGMVHLSVLSHSESSSNETTLNANTEALTYSS